jgi:hypothetical protein
MKSLTNNSISFLHQLNHEQQLLFLIDIMEENKIIVSGENGLLKEIYLLELLVILS